MGGGFLVCCDRDGAGYGPAEGRGRPPRRFGSGRKPIRQAAAIQGADKIEPIRIEAEAAAIQGAAEAASIRAAAEIRTADPPVEEDRAVLHFICRDGESNFQPVEILAGEGERLTVVMDFTSAPGDLGGRSLCGPSFKGA